MTKKVRIENADTSTYGVAVEVWESHSDPNKEDVLVKTITLPYPTAMSGDDMYIHSTRYLIVREIPARTTT